MFFMMAKPIFSQQGHPHDNKKGTAATKKEQQLKQLDARIALLKKNLAAVHDKHQLLHQELEKNEKAINVTMQQSHAIESDIQQKQRAIIGLQQQKIALGQQLEAQEKLLSQQLRLLYELGEKANPDRLLRQQQAQTQQHMQAYHRYLIKGRKKAINAIATTHRQLVENEARLSFAIESQQLSYKKLSANRKQSLREHLYHMALVRSLRSEIHNKEQALNEAEEAKKRLSQLLQQLPIQKASYAKVPFVAMHHKLLNPLKNAAAMIKKTGQGLVFVAPEGTAVHAVYPGKVVFSDWLNGYGLLLILDHGQGYMTLYAHNQSLLKHKGTYVSQNEVLATVGHSGGSKMVGLYFELRKAGRPIMPLAWFAKGVKLQ